MQIVENRNRLDIGYVMEILKEKDGKKQNERTSTSALFLGWVTK